MRTLCAGAAVLGVLSALVALFYRAILFQGLILGDYDAFVYFYPLRQYAAESLLQGRFPLWNPHLFMGSPFFANVQTAVLYPLNAIFLFMSTPYAYTASMVFHILLAGVSMYLFSRRTLRVHPLPAIVAATTLMFSGFMLGQVGHINQLNVSAWLPMLLVVFDEALRRRSLALAIATGIVGSLQLLAGHTQEWYFSAVALGLLAGWRVLVPASSDVVAARGARPEPAELPPLAGAELPPPAGTEQSPAMGIDSPYKEDPKPAKEGALASRLRSPFYLACAAAVEIGLTAVQVLPSLELSRDSIRGGGMPFHEAVSFSLPPTTLLYTILSTYPSELFSEYVGYVGVAPLVLAILAVIAWIARPITAFMAGLTLLGLFMALGRYNPAYPFLFDIVPGLDLFRVPARWLLLYTFGVSGLAGLGAQLVCDLGRRPARIRRSWIQKAPRLLGFLLGNLGLVAGGVAFFLIYMVATPRPEYDQIEVWVALVALTLALVALGSLGRRVGWVALGAILVVIVGELWVAGERTSVRHPIPFEAYKPDRPSTAFLLRDAVARDGPGRLLTFATDRYEIKETPDYQKDYAWIHADALVQFMVDMKLSEALASNLPLEYGIDAVDGYDGGILPLKRYAELKSLLMPMPGVPADNQLRQHLVYAPSMRYLDLLNVRYLLSGKIQDARIDNVNYDRAITMVVKPDEKVVLRRMPQQKVTSIGIISSTEGAREEGDGVVVATLRVTDFYGATYPIPVRLGTETAETTEQDETSRPVQHRRPPLAPTWDPNERATEFFAKIELPNRNPIKEITVQNLLPSAKLRIRAITLIDDVGGESYPLVMSERLDRETFFDMKLYTLKDPLPRAYVVPRTVLRDDPLALQALRDPALPLDQLAVLTPSPTARAIYRPADVSFEPREARVRSYAPEEVVVDVAVGQESYLILSDVYFPGWKAEVDGVETPIERANYLFRGVLVDKGSHTVVFRYDPQSFEMGLRISLGSLALVLSALLLLALDHGLRPRRAVV